MKNTKLYIAVAAAMGLSSCADENVVDYLLGKPEEVIAAEELNAYGPLLDYVAPSFKIGNTISLDEFNQKGAATTLTTSNFNEITLNGIFSYSKRVNDEGAVDSKLPDVNLAVEFAKESGISVFGHTLLSSDVNSTYIGGKIVPEAKDVDRPKIVVETIDLLVENFVDGKLPVGWRCKQGDNDIHEYPEDYSNAGGARVFEGFTGYKGKAIYWRNNNAEYGAQPDYPLTLTAGEYKLDFAMAAWKESPSYKVEILDASGNSIASSNVYVASPNAIGDKSADVSGAEPRELPFTVANDGNYTIRFVTQTEGWSEFLLLDCKVDVLQEAEDADYTDYLVENFVEGKLPVGWRCDQGDNVIHEYPEDYSTAGGARSFEGFNGYKGKAIYWRVKNAEYGAQPDHPLSLTAGEYKLAYAVAAWKGAPSFKVEIIDAAGSSIAASDVFTAAPNAGGDKSADVTGTANRELPFTVVNDGNYIIRFTNQTEGFSEFLLLDCRVGAIKSSDAPDEPTYSEETKQIADTEIKNYITAIVGDNPDIAAWTVVENPVSDISSIWNKVLGSSYVTAAAKYARAANSSAKLFLSEKGLEDADIRDAFLDLVKAADVDGINAVVAINQDTDLSQVFTDLVASGKSIRFYILSFDTPDNLSKALSEYMKVPQAQRYGISFGNVSGGIWGDNYNRTNAYKILCESLKN